MIITGDCLEVLRGMEADSVQTCVTSPPYWGLRDYQIEPTAWETAFGLEPTPDLYIAHTVEICREIRRVLRDDGTLWWNISDSYSGSNQQGGDGSRSTLTKGGKPHAAYPETLHSHQRDSGLKPKDLCLIPQRVAIALQDDGWTVRNLIIWHKPNPMPESCTDRCTKSYEFIIFASKSRNYYYDQEAVRESYAEVTLLDLEREPHVLTDGETKDYEAAGVQRAIDVKRRAREAVARNSGRNLRDVWTFTTAGFNWEFCAACQTLYSRSEYQGLKRFTWTDDKGREHWKGICRCGTHEHWVSHFATFPPELPERCIKAGTSEWGQCPKCGKPWGRDVERISTGKSIAGPKSTVKREQGLATAFSGYDDGSTCPTFTTTGWSPRCKCDAGEPVPQTVLDPFSGAATTGVMAAHLNRRYIGIELNADYAEMSRQRIEREGGGLFDRHPAGGTGESV